MIHKLTDTLYITDLSSVVEESTDEFDLIVGVCQNSAEDNVSCPYKHFNMSDGPTSGLGKFEYQLFRDATNTVLDAVRNDKKVLVHCHAGRSRSASVCIAVLGTVQEISYMEANSQIAEIRHIYPERALAEYAKKFIIENTSIEDHSPYSDKQ